MIIAKSWLSAASCSSRNFGTCHQFIEILDHPYCKRQFPANWLTLLSTFSSCHPFVRASNLTPFPSFIKLHVSTALSWFRTSTLDSFLQWARVSSSGFRLSLQRKASCWLRGTTVRDSSVESLLSYRSKLYSLFWFLCFRSLLGVSAVDGKHHYLKNWTWWAGMGTSMLPRRERSAVAVSLYVHRSTCLQWLQARFWTFRHTVSHPRFL